MAAQTVSSLEAEICQESVFLALTDLVDCLASAEFQELAASQVSVECLDSVVFQDLAEFLASVDSMEEALDSFLEADSQAARYLDNISSNLNKLWLFPKQLLLELQ